MKRGYADTPAGQIHYRVHGSGEPLLLLHQTPRGSQTFTGLMQRLGGRHQCFAPDTLGFGNSDPLPADATMEGLAQNMVNFLDAQGIERAHVLGFHTGNKIAAAMAAQFPARVACTVLVGMTHSLVVSREGRDAAIMNLVKGYFAEHAPNADGSHLLREWAANFANLSDLWWDRGVLHGPQITEATLRRQESRVIEAIQARYSARQIYEMNFAFDLAEAIGRIPGPTLVIECCIPREAHLGRQGPAMLALLKRGKLVTLEGASHDATEARADDIAKATLDFISQR